MVEEGDSGVAAEGIVIARHKVGEEMVYCQVGIRQLWEMYNYITHYWCTAAYLKLRAGVNRSINLDAHIIMKSTVSG